MRSAFYRIIILLLIVIGCLGGLVRHALAQSSTSASQSSTASPPITFTPEIPIFGLLSSSFTISSSSIGEYIRVIFVAFIWVVGILATFMVIYGGVRWVAAAGNAGRIKDARNIIDNAVIGIIIALTSVVLLNIINPSLTKFNSINLGEVSKEMVQWQNEVLTAAGSSGAITKCSAPVAIVSGSPDKLCKTVSDCTYPLNDWVQQAASAFSVDPFLIKSIILHESPKSNGLPITGPTTLSDGTGSGRLGSAYGIGQFTAQTLITILPKVNNGTIPTECSGSADLLRQANGSLVTACAQWLDNHLQLQVSMVAALLADALKGRCVSDDLTKAVLGYAVGQGNAAAFCNNQYDKLRFVTPQYAATYLQQINTLYQSVCQTSKQANYQQTTNPGKI